MKIIETIAIKTEDCIIFVHISHNLLKIILKQNAIRLRNRWPVAYLKNSCNAWTLIGPASLRTALLNFFADLPDIIGHR
jgi:hypothetical protein